MSDQASTASSEAQQRDPDHAFFVGLARAFGGAIFFSLPLLMTMEMWWLGFYMNRFRLALFMVLMIPLLIVLDRYAGFKATSTWGEDVVDGVVAYGVGFMASAGILLLLNIINFSMPPGEIIGKIALQAVPASFGAVLASSQLGGSSKEKEQKKQSAGYGTELFFMVAGAIFLAFNVAPTEEMILIAFQMTAWHTVGLAITSLLLMHAFVYAVDFKGEETIPPGTPWWSMALRFTVVGYAIALLVSAYVLWTFGRFEDHAFVMYIKEAIVLGFPASIGAAAARLIL